MAGAEIGRGKKEKEKWTMSRQESVQIMGILWANARAFAFTPRQARTEKQLDLSHIL